MYSGPRRWGTEGGYPVLGGVRPRVRRRPYKHLTNTNGTLDPKPTLREHCLRRRHGDRSLNSPEWVDVYLGYPSGPTSVSPRRREGVGRTETKTWDVCTTRDQDPDLVGGGRSQ